jgi:hypothetical protein
MTVMGLDTFWTLEMRVQVSLEMIAMPLRTSSVTTHMEEPPERAIIDLKEGKSLCFIGGGMRRSTFLVLGN